MKRGVAACAVILGLTMGCVSQRKPLPITASEVERARSTVQALQEKALAERRIKALFTGRISPKVGPIGRGFVSLFWDGLVLRWRTSVAIAGNLQEGEMVLGGGKEARLLPPPFTEDDAISVFLGVPVWEMGDAVVERFGGRYRLSIAGRSVEVTSAGVIDRMRFPDGTVATLEPGDGLPRSVRIEGRSGIAELKLESLAPW